MSTMNVRWVVDSWSNDPQKIPFILGPMLESLSLINCDYLKRNPAAPWLYRAGLRYQREKSYWKDGKLQPQEDWRDFPAILRHGGGDCEDLACARVAELRVRCRQPARPIVTAQFVRHWTDRQGRPLPPGMQPNPRDHVAPHWLYHIKVGVGLWREDPSRLLGMGTSAELPNDFPEIP